MIRDTISVYTTSGFPPYVEVWYPPKKGMRCGTRFHEVAFSNTSKHPFSN